MKAVYLMGLMAANEYIVEGSVAPEKALGSGLIDAVVESKEELVSAATVDLGQQR